MGSQSSTEVPSMSEKPFSPACERNREPIFSVLQAHFADRRRVLEIGSGTGQHAAYFAAALPYLVWQASDRSENIPGIQMWLDEAALPNTPAPLEFDVATQQTPLLRERSATIQAPSYDAIFSANTLHIMSWEEVERMFAALPILTTSDAKLAIYGPFNYAGKFTSASNAAFDHSLKQRVPHMGIRDFEDVNRLAQSAGLALLADVAMPANNRCLVWQRTLG
jgi:cyclopropane fatty-acyl-phospholipid synthase-like methyltransferase